MITVYPLLVTTDFIASTEIDSMFAKMKEEGRYQKDVWGVTLHYLENMQQVKQKTKDRAKKWVGQKKEIPEKRKSSKVPAAAFASFGKLFFRRSPKSLRRT